MTLAATVEAKPARTWTLSLIDARLGAVLLSAALIVGAAGGCGSGSSPRCTVRAGVASRAAGG